MTKELVAITKSNGEESNSKLIFDHIFGMIRNGQLKPGDKLPTEREYAEKLNVSRNSLREALKALSFIGLVTTTQGGGTYINKYNAGFLGSVLKYITVIDNTLLTEIIQVRKALESEAAELAAKNAAQEDIKKLEELVLKREALVEESKGNFDLYRDNLNDLDSEFHLTISKASGNSVICEFISAISDIFRMHQNKAARKFQSPVIANSFHRKIYNAIKGRNPELAKEVMEAHIASIETVIKTQEFEE